MNSQNSKAAILLSVNPNNPTPPGSDFSGNPAEYAAAWVAKEICTRVFGANADPQSTLATEATLIGLAAPGFNPSLIEVTIDETQKAVTVSHPGLPDRTAIHTESQGCIILPVGVNELAFTPQTIEWLGPPEDALWPLGEVVVEGESLIDKTALEAALDTHIERTGIRAIVVVHEGELVGERYAPGYGAMVPQRAWSTGKSVAATAIGRMIDQGYLGLDQKVPVEAWANDERQEITIRNLLNMSSGLDQEFDRGLTAFFTPENEHTFIYVEGFDIIADAVEVPPGAFTPGTEYAYRNANPLIATAVARLAFAEGSSQDELAFLAREVFEPLGMRSSFVETDLYGNFLTSGAFYSTARDLARLALVHLQEGKFGGNRVLSEEWTNFVYQPSPGLENFGAYWRNNINGGLNLPTDAFFASGGFGQRSIAIPSRDLVIAQLAFDPLTDDENFELFVNEVVNIIDTTTPIPEPESSTFEPIFGSLEADIIEVSGSGGLIFGGESDDSIDASINNEGNNRIYASSGDDIIILGMSDRIIGGAGDDKFFTMNAGDNIITGGTGKDQFWIATAEIPDTANIITDFTSGEDVLGIAGLGIGFDDLSITQQEDNTLIAANGSDLAILQGIGADSLIADNFAFA